MFEESYPGMYCTALFCIVLNCIALICTVRTALRHMKGWQLLFRTALYRTTMGCTALRCFTVESDWPSPI
jgi:hypothetical protein